MYNSGNSSKNVTGSAIVDGTVEAADLATAVNNDIADGVAGKATADLALPKAGGTMTGTIAGFTSTGIDDNATSTAITIDASENVGIGTATPAYTLHIDSGSGTTTQLIKSANTTGEGRLFFGDPDAVRVGAVQYNHSGNYMTLWSNGTERVRILSTGGITFNGDTAAANALDDYETGNIDISTMSFLTSGSLTTNTNYQLLSYTKIGNLVTVTGNIYVNTVTAQSGALKIPLPFTSGTGQEHRSAGIIKHYQEQTAETFVKIDTNAAYGLVLKAPSWGASTIANGDTLIVNLTYTV